MEKGRVTLLDFGIAKMNLKPGVTQERSLVGTKCYMSPEQLRGEKVDGRSDLYAAGMVLYEMLCGHPPWVPDIFNVPSFNQLLVQHLTQPLPDLRSEVAGLPEDVWQFVEQLCAKDPNDRPQSAEAALATARALRGKHKANSRLFSEDIEDVIVAMDSLRIERGTESAAPMITNPMQTDPTFAPGAFAETEPDRRNDAAPPTVLTVTPSMEVAPDTTPQGPPVTQPVSLPQPLPPTPAPAQAVQPTPKPIPAKTPLMGMPQAAMPLAGRPTARLSHGADTRPLELWEEVQWKALRKFLDAPRVFRRPALIELDPSTHAAVAIHELRNRETILGRFTWDPKRPQTNIGYPGASLGLKHVAVRVSADSRVTVELLDDGYAMPDALIVDGEPDTAAELHHGSFLRCRELLFRVEDLNANDPTGALTRIKKRKRPAMLEPVRDGNVSRASALGAPLTLVGSANACDLRIESETAKFSVAVWLRADGELELDTLDESRIPYSDPVVRCRLLKHGDALQISPKDTLEVVDPPENASLAAGVGTPLARRVAATVKDESPSNPYAASYSKSFNKAVAEAEEAAAAEPKDMLELLATVKVKGTPIAPLEFVIPEGQILLGNDPREAQLVIMFPRLLAKHAVMMVLPSGELRIRALGPAPLEVNGELVVEAIIPSGGEFSLPRVCTYRFKAKPTRLPEDPTPEPPLSGFARMLRKIGLG